MKNTYVDYFITLEVTDDVRELLPALLNELGFEGFLEEENGFHCYIHQELLTEDVQHAVSGLLDTVFHAPQSLVSQTELQ